MGTCEGHNVAFVSDLTLARFLVAHNPRDIQIRGRAERTKRVQSVKAGAKAAQLHSVARVVNLFVRPTPGFHFADFSSHFCTCANFFL
jgi:hypothetical protein